MKIKLGNEVINLGEWILFDNKYTARTDSDKKNIIGFLNENHAVRFFCSNRDILLNAWSDLGQVLPKDREDAKARMDAFLSFFEAD